MKRALTSLAVIALMSVATSAQASTTIDFRTYASGTLLSANGVSFSTAGGQYSDGTAVISNVFFDSVNSLNNSSIVDVENGNYPTAEQLIFTFSQAASLVSFTFNNYGNENGSFYTAYDSLNGVVGTGIIDFYGAFDTVNVTGSGIRRLVLDNGTNGTSDWVFGVGQLNFTAGVPEPSTWAMMLAGFGMIGFAARRRSAVKTTVTYA